MDFIRRRGNALANDHTIKRARRDGARATRALPRATANYLMEKVPIVHWLPRYNPRWLFNDILGGITVGVLLIPQSLAYAKLATIPGEYGLMSSWLPNFLYFIMGTSKDMSTGPTSLMGLLTAEIIREISTEGDFAPQSISAAVAMSVGIYCLVVGLFKLGFLLEFVSVPVLHGFISGVAIVIMLGQIPSLFGIDAGTGTANIIRDIFTQIPDFDGPTVGVGLGCIVLLLALEKMGAKWGKKSKIIWMVGLARSAIVLLLFTGISYGVNKDIDLENDDPVWALSKVQSNGISAPKMPSSFLITHAFPRAIAPFLACAIEHLAIAKAFERKNNYVVDPGQELVYLGVTNFFNGFFNSMPVGGAMSRTAVNSATGVKSPMYGLVAGGFVILSIFALSPALFWIPKATLAAIIVLAVWSLLSPPKTFVHYWKTSFVDFTASMLAFWVTLFVNTEVGIGSAVGFQLVCYIGNQVFTRIRRITALNPSTGYPPARDNATSIPPDAQVFKPHESVVFFNAVSIKCQCFDNVQTFNTGVAISREEEKANRSWSTAGERRAKQLRRRAGITEEPYPIRVVVLDLTMVATIDDTGLVALQDLQIDLKRYAGADAELRFASMNDKVRTRFERFGWELYGVDEVGESERKEKKGNAVYASVEDAVADMYRKGSAREMSDVMVVGDEKA